MKIKICLLSAICVLIFSTNVFSQFILLSEKEYQEKMNAARAKSNSEYSRRYTMIFRTHEGNVGYINRKVVNEIESKTRNSLTIFEMIDDELKIVSEKIEFDGKKFEREKEGEWVLLKPKDGEISTLIGTSPESMEQYYSIDTVYKKQRVMAYSYYSVVKYEKHFYFQEYTTFVDRKNRIVYAKSISSFVHPRNVKSTVETIYEYNPENLKIEIPSKYKTEK